MADTTPTIIMAVFPNGIYRIVKGEEHAHLMLSEQKPWPVSIELHKVADDAEFDALKRQYA